MSYSDSGTTIAEEGPTEGEPSLTRSSSLSGEPWMEPTAMKDSLHMREMREIEHTVNSHKNLICGLSNRAKELEIDKMIIFDLLKSVANAVNAFEGEKNRMRNTIEELQDEINSLKRARDEIVAYVDERVEENTRMLGKRGNSVTRKGRIRLEVTIGGDYREEN